MAGPIGVGLVGLGLHGMRYARHLQDDLPGARLVAVCRRDAAAGGAWAQAHGIRFVPDYRDLVVDDEIDVVAVITPPDLNAPVALAALAAGKAVLVEKPIAVTLEDGRRLLQASRAAGCPVMVAQTLRYNAVVRALQKEAAGLGRLILLALNQRFEPSDRPWLDRPGPGGILLNTGIHSFDLVRFLSGREITGVWCRTLTVATRRTPDAFVAALELDGGILATVDNCRATAARSGRIELVGERGQISGDHVLGSAARLVEREARRLEIGKEVPTVLAVLAAFLTCVRDGTPPPVPVEDGLKALEVVAACELSSRENRPVALREIRGR